MLRGFANMAFLVLQDAGEDKEIFTAILNEVSWFPEHTKNTLVTSATMLTF